MNKVEITSTTKESDNKADNFVYTATIMNPRQELHNKNTQQCMTDSLSDKVDKHLPHRKWKKQANTPPTTK